MRVGENMNYYIGIDGGGSKSNLGLYDKNLNKVIDIKLPAFNFLANNIEDKIKIIFREIDSLKKKYNISGIGLGISGIDSESDSLKLKKIMEKKYPNLNIVVVNDGVACLTGALLDKPGILINAGTGSIAIGKDNKGNIHRAGGWDYIIGDEGSGYWIAMEFIKTALLKHDQNLDDPIITVVKKYFKLNAINEILNHIYDEDFNKEEIAAFAEKVAELAVNGNQVAVNIYKEAGNKLAELVKIIYKKGNYSDNVLLTYNGSIFKSFSLFKNEFFDYLNKNNINYSWSKPEREPEAGAVILAKK
jgi:N-acetylglucosamine kinase-like BadF-type ATPase